MTSCTLLTGAIPTFIGDDAGLAALVTTGLPSGARFWSETTGTMWMWDAAAALWFEFQNPDGAPGAMDCRFKRFIVAGDMPSDITDAALVLAKMVLFTTFSATAYEIEACYDGGASPICNGVFFTLNPLDAASAKNKLALADTAAGGTSSAGIADTWFVGSGQSRKVSVAPGDTVRTVYFVGMPVGFTPANITPGVFQLIVKG